MYAAFALLLFLSGLRTEQGGVFYLGDAAVLVMFGWGLTKGDLVAWLLKIRPVSFGLGFFVAAAVFLDLWNQVPISDIGRGVARNVIFTASVLGGLFVIRKYGIKAWAWLLFWMMLGFPLCTFIETPDYLGTIEVFAKFGGGSSLMVAFSIFLARSGKRISALMVMAGAVFFFFNSFRGMMLMCTAVGVGAMGLPLRTHGARFRLLLALALLGFLFGLWMLSSTEFFLGSLLGDDILFTQERSSTQRLDMASLAWSNFLENPVTGIGTWQFTRNYVDILALDDLVGVHSVIIQLACEYGVIGLFAGVVVFVVACMALHRMTFAGKTDDDMVTMALLWSAAMVCYNFLFSPFNGDNRFFYGLMFSGLVAVLLRPEPVRARPQEPLPAPGREPEAIPGSRWTRSRI